MGRLVVVSNRVADPRKPGAGGLAVALADALQSSGGLWFGWSGKVVDEGSGGQLRTQRAGPVTLATVDLARADHDAYYLGYSNGVLWPVFHYRLDLADFDAGDIDGYRRVNRLFAHKLQPLLKPDDVIWVHDYHLIPLAAELRAMGCTQRMGFFLHIPLPPRTILAAIPQHHWLMRSLMMYDLVGFQTRLDVEHFSAYVVHEDSGERCDDHEFRVHGRSVRARDFPIGIDVDEFQALGREPEARETFRTMKEQYAQRQLLVGVDRLDYSKGMPQRIRAFRRLLEHYPENRRVATLIQVAAPSREDVEAYADLRLEMETLCGAVNGDYGELDWMPVRYMRRAVPRRRLPGLYAASSVALVTPLRDGMNLVAKEYVAAQDPVNPGVLVLSRFAGAAEAMTDALIVNPYDTDGTAEVIQQALRMPLEERRARHERLMAGLRARDVHWWAREFLAALQH
ncbi:alpha,alpha-trehalose-phosphate synthase (UDP-forming) [Rubrivivax albus]|uniref:Trehalose-6-phosphate synthase n=1 Tax=Rubrivivax albus TaxID=2499835 RepID=A0A437JYN4_9BURK|nr:alpha,alpha-trehalose-phosphate synthase (UDP-forming) [Rubrivivax albus]RVT52782.1 alpha,alpha-trehalose-phosphate synthase (UDP-forming) [Rubrivivax albus]